MSNISSELRRAANLWRVKIDDGLSDAEQADFDTWLATSHAHGQALAEAEIFWSASGRPEYLAKLAPLVERNLSEAASGEAAGNDNVAHLHRETYATSGLAASWSKLVGASLAIAASIAIFFAAGGPQLFTANPAALPRTYVTEADTTQIITLADDTRITLGVSSMLEVELTEEMRNTRLTRGSAFFDVTSDQTRPFTVRTNIGEVLVTGTRFDVELREDNVTISVTEGSVEVSKVALSNNASDSKPVILKANQAVDLNALAGFGEIYEVAPTDRTAESIPLEAPTQVTSSAQLIYIREPLRVIVEDLNRYADRPITVSDEVAMLELSGTYDASDLDALLRSLEQALPVRVVADGQGRRILPR